MRMCCTVYNLTGPLRAGNPRKGGDREALVVENVIGEAWTVEFGLHHSASLADFIPLARKASALSWLP